MADKIDPFDVAALERSLNDSATRVSTIWVSFLIFSLYLLTAATTVTHRQLFLAEPVKLPVLNIDLPLWGFFFLAPILFLIFHAYVLLQVLLLGRTAAAYNDVVERADVAAEENALLRQRLANTLFAQIFAGSPRERDGWLGWLLKAMAWVTLAIAPILILLVFQFMFLPYHSHLATWTHRLLILAELAVMFLLWPLVLDARRDFDQPKLKRRLKEMAAFPFVLALFLLSPLLPAAKSNSEHSTLRRRLKRIVKFPVALVEFLLWSLMSIVKRDFKRSKLQQRSEFRRLRHQAVPVITCGLSAFLSLSLATFPGEPHVNLFTGQVLSSVQCGRWFHQKFAYGDTRFDRLDLPGVDVVDDEKLAKIVQATSDRKLRAFGGERTRNFRGRDLNCGDLSSADLRRVDLTGAHLSTARLDSAALEGATLVNAQLQGASLNSAELQGVELDGAQLQGASLESAQLQGANLTNTQLQGANLESAQLQGAILNQAQLQGANLGYAQLQGAFIYNTSFQGADFNDAELQGAFLDSAQLQGAYLGSAQLQGTTLTGSVMIRADLSDAYVWRAQGAVCLDASVTRHRPDAIIERFSYSDDKPVRATPDEITKFIERSIAGIADASVKETTRSRMRNRFVVDSTADDTTEVAQVWSDCEEANKRKPDGEVDVQRAQFLRDLICDAEDNRKVIASGIIRNWFPLNRPPSYVASLLARGLLSHDKPCAATEDFDEPTKRRLRAAMAPAAIVPIEPMTTSPAATR